jgi:hypothetical protein
MKNLFLALFLVLALSSGALAEPVTLKWDAVNPAPTGYRIYQRVAKVPYNYLSPVWQGPETTCTIDVPVGTEAAFVARAYVVGGITGKSQESGDSNEVIYLKSPASPKNMIIEGLEQMIQGLNKVIEAVKIGG